MIADDPDDVTTLSQNSCRELLHQTQHLQLKQGGDDLRGRRIFNLFKQIVDVYGGIHLQRLSTRARLPTPASGKRLA